MTPSMATMGADWGTPMEMAWGTPMGTVWGTPVLATTVIPPVFMDLDLDMDMDMVGVTSTDQ